MGSSASRPEDTPDPAPAGGQQVLTPAERDQVLTALTVYGRARERFKTRTARAVGKGALTVVNAATGVAVSVIAGPIAISARLAAGPVAVAACRSVLGFVLGTIGAAIGLVGATHIYSFKGLELTRLDSPGEGAKKVNHVIVCIMGFLCADQSPSKMFEAVINAHSNTEVWAVKWDGSTTVRALTSALYPLFNEWGRAKNAAEACGVTLAEVISNPLFGSLPITLVGHSLGGRMIMYALKHLQQAELRHPPLKDVVLLGGACPGDVEEWSVLLGSYRGGLINCYNREDSVLRTAYRPACLHLGDVAGLGPIRVGPVFKPRVHNVDVGALVPAGLPTFGHNYLPHLQEIWDDISPLLGSAVEHLPDPAELLVGHRSLFSAPLPIGDVGGEIAMLKCSWCAQHAKHRRITSPALGRSTYQCASCNQKTIICRCCQAAMARARFVDDDYCSDCQSRPIRVPRPSRRYCSWCLEITLHACTEASISGPDEFVCCSSACGKPTTRCNHCLRAMAKITMLKKLDMCHWCYEANARDCLAGRLRKSLFA